MSGFSSLDLRSNLQLASLGDVNRPFAVHDVSGNYQSLYMLLALISMGQDPEVTLSDGSPEIRFSRGFYSTDGRFTDAYQDDVTISDTVGARNVLANGNLLITLAGAVAGQPHGFRVGDIVQAGADYRRKGQVMAVTATTIEVQPAETLTAFAVTDFALGQFFAVHYDSSPVVRSPGKTSLTIVPRTDWNCISTLRDSHDWSLQNTSVGSLLDTRGLPEGLWQNAQITEMSKRLLRSVDRMLISSQRAQGVQGPFGLQDSTGGLDWSLRNRGGYVVDLNSAMTRAQFENWLVEVMSSKTGGHTRRPWLIMGRAAFARISSFGTGDFIRYQRDLTPSQGSNVMGANFGVYQVAGYEVNLAVAEALDNRYLFPQMSVIPGVNSRIRSNDIYLLDGDSLPTLNGMGYRPAIQMLHWSKDGTESGGSPFYAGVIRGMNMAEISDTDIMNASANPIVTDIEASSLHLMYKGGMDMITGKFSGKIGYLI
jgi:hypothetical protein